MKFTKFVKSLASNGVIFERGATGAEFIAERWLASPSALMLIPPTVRSVTATGVHSMPSGIEDMIASVGNTQCAMLHNAVMPYADGKIKDCLRVFKTVDEQFQIAISNDDWSLIEKSDFCEILYRYDLNAESYTAKALLVKSYPKNPADREELVGIIFPVGNTPITE